MKKFSNITGEKISTSLPSKKSSTNQSIIDEQDSMKGKILQLMEQFLVVRTYGPVDRYQRAGNIKIAGKEVFLEALMNLFNTKNLKEQTKLLESLKSEIGDWQMIDNKVNEVNNKLTSYELDSKLLIQKQNILKLYNKYKDDQELLLKMVDESCKKIKSFAVATQRVHSSELLYNESKLEIFKKITEKFQQRANQIK